MFSKDPGREAELHATLGYANYDRVSGQIYASMPLGETVGFNISVGGADQRSGWGRSITTGEDAIEFLMAGASAIQVGTATFANPRAPLDVLEGIECWLAENGVGDVSEIVGCAIQR